MTKRAPLWGAVAGLLLSAAALSVLDAAPVHAVATAGRQGPSTAPPKVGFLTGRTIVTGQGKHLAIPVPASHAAHLQLLGHSPSGWVVVDSTGDHSVLFTVSRSHQKTQFWKVADKGTHQFTLSDDGTRVAQSDLDQLLPKIPVTVFTVTGTVVAKRGFKADRYFYDGGVYDFTGTRLVASFYDTYDWTIGHQPVLLSTGVTAGADIAHGVLFSGHIGAAEVEHVGPAPLTDPDHPAWTRALDFVGIAVSPQGDKVLYAYQDDHVRAFAMSDATLLGDSGDRGSPEGWAWESESTYLVLESTSGGSRIERCAVALGGHPCVFVTAATSQHVMLATRASTTP